MTAVSVRVSLCSLLAIAVQGGPAVVITSIFDVAENKQLPSNVCSQEVASPSKASCAVVSDVTPTSNSFTFTCSNNDASSSCRCFLCSVSDLSVATTAQHATSGMKMSTGTTTPPGVVNDEPVNDSPVYDSPPAPLAIEPR